MAPSVWIRTRKGNEYGTCITQRPLRQRAPGPLQRGEPNCEGPAEDGQGRVGDGTANAFQEHLEQTKVHVQRLEEIFDKLDVSPKGRKCQAMEGLIEEGKELMDEDANPEVLDAGLIAAAQKVEHYEMAGYGCARTYAQHLGDQEAANLLQQTLDEEGVTDKKLTQLAESTINVEAARKEQGNGLRGMHLRGGRRGARTRR